MQLADLVSVSARVAETPARGGKTELLSSLLRRVPPGEVRVAVSFLSGEPTQGRVGVGAAAVAEAASGGAAEAPRLTLAEVDRALGEIGALAGPGAGGERRRLLGELFGRATRAEQGFLSGLLLRELRQGALEGVLVEALARASGAPPAELRAALTVAGSLPEVAETVLAGGRPGLARFTVTLFRPLRPMLAQPADDAAEALAALGRAGLEWKLDGARVQVHKQGRDVRIFTRTLLEVTDALPEVAASAAAWPVREAVADGEALALDRDGRPLPFQTTMRRFGRKVEEAELTRELPLTAFYFDLLYADGRPLVDRPAAERFAALEEALPPPALVPRLVTGQPGEAEAFLAEALARGHEGLLAKSLAAPYEAGRRGAGWRKIKRAHTLDLVVLAAEWGHGRRSGWLSNLHLGARDPESDGFAMLGKTFKGLTDRLLAWQTRRLLELELLRDAQTVYVEPRLVVEVAFDGLQASPRYPAGLALRFARVRRYRPDKDPSAADTLGTVRALFAAQQGRAPPAGG